MCCGWSSFPGSVGPGNRDDSRGDTHPLYQFPPPASADSGIPGTVYRSQGISVQADHLVETSGGTSYCPRFPAGYNRSLLFRLVSGGPISGWLIPVRGANLGRRFLQLNTGLVLFGIGIGFMLESGLGVPPWDVLHQGLAARTGLSVGAWSIMVSFLVLLLWIPLRERYGVGTLLNAVVIGVMIDVTVAVLPAAGHIAVAVPMLAFGIFLIGFGSGLYIGANLGPGPRDGLMTGIARRGLSIRVTRWLLELTVLATGWLLGGTFGIGTVAFVILIGPTVQFFLPRWSIDTGFATDAWDHPAR